MRRRGREEKRCKSDHVEKNIQQQLTNEKNTISPQSHNRGENERLTQTQEVSKHRDRTQMSNQHKI